MANYWIGLSRIIPKLFSFDHGDHGGSPSHHFIIPRCRWKPPSGPESLAKSIGPHRCDRGLSKVGRGQWIWWRVCLWYDQFKIYFLGIAGTTYVLYTISMYTHTYMYIYTHSIHKNIPSFSPRCHVDQAFSGRNSAAMWQSRSCRMRGWTARRP